MKNGILERLSSYTSWPISLHSSALWSPSALVNAGFVHARTGTGNRVKCPVCKLELECCAQQLHPRDYHRTRSPQCSLAQACCSQPTLTDADVIRRQFEPSNTNYIAPDGNALKPEPLGNLANGRRADDESDYESGRSAVSLRTSSATDRVSADDKTNVLRPDTNELLPSATFTTKHSESRNIGGLGRQQNAVNSSPPRNTELELSETAPPPRNPPIDRSNPDYDKMRFESVRLSTFFDWPETAPVKPGELAANGWFFTGHGDRVRCAFCRGALHHWAENDQPAAEHCRHFSDCAFVKGTNVGNVPLGGNVSSAGPAPIGKTASDGGEHANRRNSNEDLNHSRYLSPTTLLSMPNGNNCKEDIRSSKDKEEETQLWLENKQLKDAKTCKVCMNADVDTVFLPCGHLVACSACSPQLRNCPICRTYIRGTVKTIFVSD